MKKVTCPKCHGKGETTCSRCGGKGVKTCYKCHGTGHACPVCSGFGIGMHQGYVKNQYGDLIHCPNCHGDYKNKKYTCETCGGRGKVPCKKTETCSACNGTGKVNVASKLNLELFRAFSMAFGFTGLQYLYIGRWLLFVLQFSTFAALGVMVIFFEPVLSFVSRFGIDRECLKMVKNLMCVCVLLNPLLGMIIIKRDKQGGTLNHEYKRGWYWLFFLLFGWTGAHIAYVSRRVRDLYWCFAYGLVMTPIFVNVIVSEIKGCANKDFDMGDVLVRLIVYGAIFVIFMGGGTKFVRRMIESRSC